MRKTSYRNPIRLRWKYTRDGVTYYVYSQTRPSIKGIARAGHYDRKRNVVVCDDLCDFTDHNQFCDGRKVTG